MRAPISACPKQPTKEAHIPVPSTSTEPRKTFTITASDETTTVSGRHEAVKVAKRMSRRTWRPVHVERADEKLTMSYHRGTLQDFRHDPRRGKRRH